MLERDPSWSSEPASWVISGFVTAAIKKYTDDSIDGAVKVATDIIDQFKLNEKLKKINAGESDFATEGLDSADFEQDAEKKWVRREKESFETRKEQFESILVTAANETGIDVQWITSDRK